MEKEQDYWKAETVAFLALQSIRGVGFSRVGRLVVREICANCAEVYCTV